MPAYVYQGRTYYLEGSAVQQAGGIEGYFKKQKTYSQAKAASAAQKTLTVKNLASQGEAYKAYGFSSDAEMKYFASQNPSPQKVYQIVDSVTGKLINPDRRGLPACFNPMKNAQWVDTGRVAYSEADGKIITAKNALSEINALGAVGLSSGNLSSPALCDCPGPLGDGRSSLAGYSALNPCPVNPAHV